MSKILNFTVMLFVCVGMMQCSKNPLSPTDKLLNEITSLDKKVIESDGSFGIKLFKKIAKEESKNIFISPLSVSMALGMTYNGADGSTQEAMQNTLELNGLSIQDVNESYKKVIELLAGLDYNVKFQIANSIWYRNTYDFEKEFFDICEEYFNSEVQGLDFDDPNAKNIINEWVNTKTSGKIKEIVERIDPISAMFLINAIYFKGTWKYKFDENETKDDLFTLPNGSKIKCKMMKQENDFEYFADADFQAVELPYGEGSYRMTIILPHPDKEIGQLISELTTDKLNQWFLSFSKQGGILEMPRFKMEYKINLNDVLKALGMGIAFSNEANFTKMDKKSYLFIREVLHKTFVEVNEEGTEAAAATSVEMGFKSAEPKGIFMRVDRPFIFLIRENISNTILFIGKIVEPIM